METNQLNVSRKNYVKSLLTIAVPIMLGNIISQVQMLVDKAFLGHVNEFYLSALGNVSSPMWTSMSFCFTIVLHATTAVFITTSVHRFSSFLFKAIEFALYCILCNCMRKSYKIRH